MRRGDNVLVLCTVTDVDPHGYTMMVSAFVYQRGEQVAQVTQCDMLIRNEK